MPRQSQVFVSQKNLVAPLILTAIGWLSEGYVFMHEETYFGVH